MNAWKTAFACLLLAAPVAAPAQDDILNKIINKPGSAAVHGAPAKSRKDEGVQGGKALRVDSPGKPNAWDISLSTDIDKPVKAGDTLVLAFWARLEKGPDGATTVSLPYNGIQLAAAPYTPVVKDAVTVGPAWELHQITGKADKDYAPGTINATLHLAGAKQVVDIGPVFVLDMGQ